MNLEALVDHSWAGVTVVSLLIVVYLGFVYGGHKVLDYFFGWKVADRYFNALGFPIIICFWMGETIKRGLNWPWRHRDQRLLKEIFGVQKAKDLDYNARQVAQKAIDTKLSHLAYYLKIAFDRQEEARKEHKLVPELVATDYVKECKKAFWLALDTAKKGGYRVRKKYSDYLEKL